MRGLLLGGLFLTLVLQDARSHPMSNYRASLANSARSSLAPISDEGMPSLEWYNPWLLLASSYRPYRTRHFYSPFHNEFAWPVSDAESTAALESNDNHADRLVMNDDSRSVAVDKRDSYISMCHFKICNLGRKRRIAQASPSPGLRRR